MPLLVQALSLYGPQAASHRVRLSQYRQGLAHQGIDLRIQSLLDDAYLQARFTGARPSLRGLLRAAAERLKVLRKPDCDLLILYAELFPLLPALLEQRLLRRPYLYDFDDAFHLKYRSGRLGMLQPLLGQKTDRIIAKAAAITAGSEPLATYVRRFNPNVTVLPSVVDTEHYRPASTQHPGPFTVGWIGSPSTAPYLQQLVVPLKQLAHRQPVRLVVVGGKAPVIPGVEVVETPWSLEQEVPLIQSFNVGVMPLPDTPWARGKCAYKLIQCMACGIPVVASPVGANLDAVPTSVGYLADSSSDWLEALHRLATDAPQRQQMGQAARHWVEQRYSLQTALPILSGVIWKVHTSSPSTGF